MNSITIDQRVRAADTDHVGIAYFGRYFEWCEAAMIELLRTNGVTYSEMRKTGITSPVVHAELDYKNSARYDDLVSVDARIERIGNSSVTFSYTIHRKDDTTVLATGKTIHVFLGQDGKKIPVPDDVKKIVT